MVQRLFAQQRLVQNGAVNLEEFIVSLMTSKNPASVSRISSLGREGESSPLKRSLMEDMRPVAAPGLTGTDLSILIFSAPTH